MFLHSFKEDGSLRASVGAGWAKVAVHVPVFWMTASPNSYVTIDLAHPRKRPFAHLCCGFDNATGVYDLQSQRDWPGTGAPQSCGSASLGWTACKQLTALGKKVWSELWTLSLRGSSDVLLSGATGTA